MAATPEGARRCSGILERTISPGVHQVTWRFIQLLAAKRRLTLLREIAAAFAERCEKADGAVSIHLTTAFALDEAAAKGIGSRIGNAVSRRPLVRTSVNPDLLGGFVARHDDRVYDFSIAGAMQQLRQRLVEGAAEREIAR
jgi:F-type H+-transporting ATPase subunit delta